jgi:hypothetical protein
MGRAAEFNRPLAEGRFTAMAGGMRRNPTSEALLLFQLTPKQPLCF